MQKRFDYLLFDGDGTLFDFKRGEREALHGVLDRFLLPSSPEIIDKYSFINDQLWKRLERGEIRREELQLRRFSELLDYLMLRRQLNIVEDRGMRDPREVKAQDLNEAYVEALSGQAYMLPDAVRCIEALQEYFKLVLVTNGLTRVQHRRLSLSPIANCFDWVFVSEDIGYQKPDRAYFDYVCQAIGLEDRERALVIGDSLTADVRGAKNADLPVCWFNPFGLENESGLRPEYTIRSLRELKAIVYAEAEAE